MRALLLCLWLAGGAATAQVTPPAGTAAGIVAKVAANVDKAREARRHYVYHQLVRVSLVRGGGTVARREVRQYTAIPGPRGTEKVLDSFTGEYRKGKRMIAYSKPGYQYRDLDIDGDLINDLTNGLVNDKNSRDGIPHSLFPLDVNELPKYQFTLKGEGGYGGRRIYKIDFEPAKGCDSTDCDAPWKGEAWIDAEELEPVHIDTELAVKVPWQVRLFLGTNLHQTGFSIGYVRVEPNVWFPSSYGTEFFLRVLWGYGRTITLSMENTGFKKVDVTSIVHYAPAAK
jgi:hypothetical protein